MKRTILFIIFAIFYFFSSFASKETDEFPIMAYWGVNPRYATEGHFKAFADCGFNISHYAFASVEQFNNVSKVAEKFGIKLMLQSNELYSNTEKFVKGVMNSNSLYAYHVYDEPSYTKLDEISNDYVNVISKLDKKHPCYVNLLPYYDDYILERNIKTDSYLKYLKKAAKINTPQLSFDYYPIMTDGIRKTWYENLESIREISIMAGKPFWGFVLSVPHIKYPQPTLAMLRLQVYTNLAYGAKGIQYFTYWTPNSSDYDFHNAPVTVDGKFTKTYTIVKQMNTELKGLVSIFKDGTVTKVNHIGQIPKSAKRLTDMPLNVKEISVDGGNGAIVSQLLYKDKHYLVIVNKDYKSKLNVRIKANNSSVCYLDKSLIAHKLSSIYKLSGGDILIFRLD